MYWFLKIRGDPQVSKRTSPVELRITEKPTPPEFLLPLQMRNVRSEDTAAAEEEEVSVMLGREMISSGTSHRWLSLSVIRTLSCPSVSILDQVHHKKILVFFI